MSKEKIVFNLPNKTVTFSTKDFGDTEIDLEDLLQVQINNIIIDIITFPVIFNRIGLIKSQMDDLLRSTQLDFDLFCAEQRREARKEFTIEQDSKGKDKRKYLTEQGIDDFVMLSPKYKVKRQGINKVKFQADEIDALYWSGKSKDQKLNAISAKMKPEEFEHEIIEGTFNDVAIKVYKNQFPQRQKTN